VFVAGKYRTRLAYAERDARIEKGIFRTRHSQDYKTKWELEDAIVQDRRIKEIEDRVVEYQARLTMAEAVAQGYEDIRNAASREMFRRGSEKAQSD
jgi:hypothetical protein